MKYFCLNIVVVLLSCGMASEEIINIWMVKYVGQAGKSSWGKGIGLDKNNNVYVAGYELVDGQEYNILVGKYDSNGRNIWIRTYNGNDNKRDWADAVAVDEYCNIYVAGIETVNSQGWNAWIRKYATNGNVMWTRTYNGEMNGNDGANGITVDKSGNVYVTGFETVSNQGENILIIKYDTNGNMVWTTTYNNSEVNGKDWGEGIAVDKLGNIYVAGFEEVRGKEYNTWIRKYDSNGSVLWNGNYNTSAGGNDAARGITVDWNDNVYICGVEQVVGQQENAWVRKYNSKGDILWTKTNNGRANAFDLGNGVSVDNAGNIYLIGVETVEKEDIWIRKYDANGEVKWTQIYNGAHNGFDEGNGIAVDVENNVYVIGIENIGQNKDSLWIAKYRQYKE